MWTILFINRTCNVCIYYNNPRLFCLRDCYSTFLLTTVSASMWVLCDTRLGNASCQLNTYISFNHTIVSQVRLLLPILQAYLSTLSQMLSTTTVCKARVSRYSAWGLFSSWCLSREKICIWLTSLRFARSQLGSVLLAGSHGISCISLSA